MKIQILKDGFINSSTGKKLSVMEIIEVSEERGLRSIKNGIAKEVAEDKAIVPVLETADCSIAKTQKRAKKRKK